VRSQLLSVAALSVLASAAPSNTSATDDAAESPRSARSTKRGDRRARSRSCRVILDRDVQVTAGLGFHHCVAGTLIASLRFGLRDGVSARTSQRAGQFALAYRMGNGLLDGLPVWSVWSSSPCRTLFSSIGSNRMVAGSFDSELFVALDCSGAACAWEHDGMIPAAS